ncbi:DUF7848 domain-containing protein [Streptomyces sp. NPDC054933]
MRTLMRYVNMTIGADPEAGKFTVVAECMACKENFDVLEDLAAVEAWCVKHQGGPAVRIVPEPNTDPYLIEITCRTCQEQSPATDRETAADWCLQHTGRRHHRRFQVVITFFWRAVHDSPSADDDPQGLQPHTRFRVEMRAGWRVTPHEPIPQPGEDASTQRTLADHDGDNGSAPGVDVPGQTPTGGAA